MNAYWQARTGRVLLLGGAGFDSRTADVARALAVPLKGRLDGVFIREERPDADRKLHDRAGVNEQFLRGACTSARCHSIEIFDADGAVVGGRRAAMLARDIELGDYDDIVVDLSALSLGTAFPLVRTVLERLRYEGAPASRLHLMVAASPGTDAGIKHTYGDHVEPIHGFAGHWGIADVRAHAARAWLPQLRLGRTSVLDRIHGVVSPHAVLPVVPFPAADLRLGDKLLEEYRVQLEGPWEVDARNLVVANERFPLDYYRTVLNVARFREQTFGDDPGSVVVLTPMGSKVLAIGALLAAIELDLPVLYVETRAFGLPSQSPPTTTELVHLWLHPTPP